MKKFASFLLALLLCVSVLAASLRTVCSAAEPDPDHTPTVSIVPGDPDGLNTLPPDVDMPVTE